MSEAEARAYLGGQGGEAGQPGGSVAQALLAFQPFTQGLGDGRGQALACQVGQLCGEAVSVLALDVELVGHALVTRVW